MAGGRPGAVLELGVGTGRLARPLAAAGIEVWGVDNSPAMLAALAARPGGDRVRAVLADMAVLDLPPGAPLFGVAFAAFNTFFGLASREAQLACLRSVAARLVPGGHLALELFVPTSPPAAAAGQVDVVRNDAGSLVVKFSQWRPEEGSVVGRHVELTGGVLRVRRWRMLPLTPAELDAMAGCAGFDLVERTGGWDSRDRRPVGRHHVSLYRRSG